MSISSEIAAQYGNKIKNEWETSLETAYRMKDWNRVASLLKKMKKFYFSE